VLVDLGFLPICESSRAARAPVLLIGFAAMHPEPPSFDTDPTEAVTVESDVPEEAVAKPAQRVLLLEDRDDFREVLREHLVSRSFEVISVSSGVEGLGEISKGAFDLIICDMMMPRMGGEMFYWAVTRLRPATAQRFIFFTGHQTNPAIEFFFKRVKATVLIKPFELSALDSAIISVLRKLI
jgi:CheY-like chemotaxis protein